ncbi:MAG: hypothetical protein NDP19_05655, partial [Crenarchaeota archaeon]|nr:hypothetical protein [Thermoproteota archaeon]
ECKIYGTDPTLADTDGDGLLDPIELAGWNVTIILLDGSTITRHVYPDPTKVDTDGDGISDYTEFLVGSDPTRADTDGDGLPDNDECRRRTDPKKVDTDGDGLSDYDEIYVWKTDPLSKDTDGDGLSDYDEIYVWKTDPLRADTDGDGLSDYDEIYVWKTDPLRADTDGDGLSDYDEVFKTRTNSRLRDTDGDFIPDNFDILLPTTNDFTYIIVAVMLIGLLRLHSYGLFRNWRRDIIGVGLSDLGGIPMFVLPERFPVEIDISLISSGITGIFTMAGELSQRALNRIVLSGVVPILIDKGEYTLMWVFLRREYPRVIKQLSKLHREMEKTYSAILAEWSGVVEELTDVKSWLMVRLFPGARFEAKKELEALEEEFRETFKEE